MFERHSAEIESAPNAELQLALLAKAEKLSEVMKLLLLLSSSASFIHQRYKYT